MAYEKMLIVPTANSNGWVIVLNPKNDNMSNLHIYVDAVYNSEPNNLQVACVDGCASIMTSQVAQYID